MMMVMMTDNPKLMSNNNGIQWILFKVIIFMVNSWIWYDVNVITFYWQYGVKMTSLSSFFFDHRVFFFDDNEWTCIQQQQQHGTANVYIKKKIRKKDRDRGKKTRQIIHVELTANI